MPCDSPRVAFRLAGLMREQGYYACVCVFPAVPMNRPGLRFTVTRHNEIEDIAPFISALAECRALAMADARRNSMVVPRGDGGDVEDLPVAADVG